MTIRYRLFILILILIAVLAFDTQFGRNVLAQENQTAISLSVDESLAESELVIHVDLNTAEDTKYAAGAFAVSYSPAALEPIDCQVQDSFLGVCNLNRPGEVLFNALNAQGVTGNLILVTISFKVIDPESINLSLQMTEPMVNPLGYSIEASVSHENIDDLNTALTQANPSSGATPLIEPPPSQREESADKSTATTIPSTDPKQEKPNNSQKEVTSSSPTNAPSIAESSASPQIQEDGTGSKSEEKLSHPTLESATPISNSNNPDPASQVEPNPIPNLKQGEVNTNVQVLEIQTEGASRIAEVQQNLRQPLGQTSDSNPSEVSEYVQIPKTNDSIGNQILWIGLILSIAFLTASLIGIFLVINKNRNHDDL